MFKAKGIQETSTKQGRLSFRQSAVQLIGATGLFLSTFFSPSLSSQPAREAIPDNSNRQTGQNAIPGKSNPNESVNSEKASLGIWDTLLENNTGSIYTFGFGIHRYIGFDVRTRQRATTESQNKLGMDQFNFRYDLNGQNEDVTKFQKVVRDLKNGISPNHKNGSQDYEKGTSEVPNAIGTWNFLKSSSNEYALLAGVGLQSDDPFSSVLDGEHFSNEFGQNVMRNSTALHWRKVVIGAGYHDGDWAHNARFSLGSNNDNNKYIKQDTRRIMEFALESTRRFRLIDGVPLYVGLGGFGSRVQNRNLLGNTQSTDALTPTRDDLEAQNQIDPILSNYYFGAPRYYPVGYTHVGGFFQLVLRDWSNAGHQVAVFGTTSRQWGELEKDESSFNLRSAKAGLRVTYAIRSGMRLSLIAGGGMEKYEQSDRIHALSTLYPNGIPAMGLLGSPAGIAIWDSTNVNQRRRSGTGAALIKGEVDINNNLSAYAGYGYVNKGKFLNRDSSYESGQPDEHSFILGISAHTASGDFSGNKQSSDREEARADARESRNKVASMLKKIFKNDSQSIDRIMGGANLGDTNFYDLLAKIQTLDAKDPKFKEFFGNSYLLGFIPTSSDAFKLQSALVEYKEMMKSAGYKSDSATSPLALLQQGIDHLQSQNP